MHTLNPTDAHRCLVFVFSVFPFMSTSAHKLGHLARVVFPIDESLVMVDAVPSQHLDSFSLV
jgi:hypothetical protein